MNEYEQRWFGAKAFLTSADGGKTFLFVIKDVLRMQVEGDSRVLSLPASLARFTYDEALSFVKEDKKLLEDACKAPVKITVEVDFIGRAEE